MKEAPADLESDSDRDEAAAAARSHAENCACDVCTARRANQRQVAELEQQRRVLLARLDERIADVKVVTGSNLIDSFSVEYFLSV